MATATSTRQKGLFFIRSRALLLFLVFLIAFALFIVTGVHYSNSTHFSASDGSSLTITGAPGELISVTVDAGSSVSGYWASEGGLTLTLNSPSNFSSQLVAPRDRGWSSSISTSSSNPDSAMNLTGSFVIPSNIDASKQPITGQISGDVEYPEDYLFGFTNKSKSISIPVRLNIISPSTVFLTAQLPLYAITGLGILTLLALPAFFRLHDVRRKTVLAAL